jgi:peptidoglycan/LPS O-acetylase OafA/YrhL
MGLLSIDVDYGKRNFGLDVLRTYAILNVLYGHCLTFFVDYLSPRALNLAGVIVYLLDGVEVFFVLSGFLIGSILIKSFLGKADLRIGDLLNFWKRRWYRTLPNYYIILAINIVFLVFVLGKFRFAQVIPFFGFSQSLNWPHPQFFLEAWSLAVEEWFYLLLPLALYLVLKKASPRNRTRFTIVTILVFMLFSISVRCYRAISLDAGANWEDWFRKPVIGRLDAILFGVIGAMANRFKPELWKRNGKLKAGIGLFLILASYVLAYRLSGPWCLFFRRTFFFTLTSFGILLLFPLFSGMRSKPGMLRHCITRISLVSYSLYLINYSLALNVFSLFPASGLPIAVIKAVLYVACCIAVSTLMFKYLETPIMEYRDKKTFK